MKIDETGMNQLILGLPLGGVLVHAAPSATVAEQPGVVAVPGTPLQDERTRLNPTRTILWLAMGICVAAMAWMASQGALMPIPTPKPKVAMLPAQPQKVERLEVPTLEPLPPLTNDLIEPVVVAAKDSHGPMHPRLAEDPKPVTKARTIQKRAAADPAPQPIKAHSAPDSTGNHGAGVQAPAPPLPKQTRPAAAVLAPEKIDGAALGIISAANDKLVMSVDGSFRTYRPGERLPFNEVLVSVKNRTITTDRRVIELSQP